MAKRASYSKRRSRSGRSTGISPDQLAEEITRYTTEHVVDITETARRDIDKAGEDCARYVAEGAPKDTGEYAAGWDHVTSQGASYCESIVYNGGDKAYLAHLIENGYEQFYYGNDLGYRQPPRKHVAPAYERAKRELEGRVRK